MISKLTKTGPVIITALFMCLALVACASREGPQATDAMPAPTTYGAAHGKALVVSRCTECHEKLQAWQEMMGAGDVRIFRPTKTPEGWTLLLSDSDHYDSFEAHERTSILAYLTQNG